MERLKLATVWLGGCSGCHMSFLDLDEWLFELAALADLVYSPIADVKSFPAHVDVTLVEGAVANADNLELAVRLRAASRSVISFGDCAVTGNVTAMRNPLGSALPLLRAVYAGPAGPPSQRPIVPPLLERVRPLHEVIRVDGFLPGCPPSAAAIRAFLQKLIDPSAKSPEPRFGRALLRMSIASDEHCFG